MAPEQHAGLALDARTDQFAFCVSLWLALFGAPPFIGRDLDELARAKQGAPARVARRKDVPRALVDVITRGLAPDPEQRWPSMRTLLDAIARSRRTVRLAPVIVVLVVAVAILGAAAWSPATDCSDAEERLAGVWSRERHAEDPKLVQLEAMLDDRAQRWVDAWRENCAAPNEARTACLEEGRIELVALVEASHKADELARSLRAVDELAPIERCAELDATTTPPEPDDPLHAAALAHVRELVALTNALQRVGAHADALATGEDAVAQARALGHTRLRADALQALGEVHSSLGQYAEAEATLGEAFFDARESGHDVIAIDAASSLVWVVGYRLARRDEGHEWARHGEALLGSPAIGRMDEARLFNSIGAMLEDEGQLDDAEIAYHRALGLMEAERGRDHPDSAMVHNNLGNLAERRGDYVEAEAEHRIALAVRENVHGESHEMTAMSLNNLALAVQRQGRGTEAEPLYRRALAIREEVLGPEHSLVARTHMNLGVTLKNLGRFAEAEEQHRRAIAILEATLGGNHTDLASAYINLANALRKQGRTEEALAAIRRARAIFEAVLPADHPNLARVVATEAEFRADLAE
jgi:tetratricopeptide (TPR) repeat protein